jgi:hypothetical protein
LESFADNLALVEPLVEGEVTKEAMFGYCLYPIAVEAAKKRHILLMASY